MVKSRESAVRILQNFDDFSKIPLAFCLLCHYNVQESILRGVKRMKCTNEKTLVHGFSIARGKGQFHIP